jgi:hypothetical protein
VRRHFGPPRHGPRAAVFDRRQQLSRFSETILWSGGTPWL